VCSSLGSGGNITGRYSISKVASAVMDLSVRCLWSERRRSCPSMRKSKGRAGSASMFGGEER